jgi:hypothetical protein
MSLWKRVYESKKKIVIYSSGTFTIFFALLVGMSYYGVGIEVSGDQVCEYCNSTFNITLINYSLCLGSTFNGLYFEPEADVEWFRVYKADMRYKRDNPARWKLYDLKPGTCLDSGKKHEFLIEAKKGKTKTVEWSVGYGAVNKDPFWFGEPPETVIGDFQATPEIRIERQDYIDSLGEWSFEQINDMAFSAKLTFNKDFVTDLKDTLPYASSNTRWTTLRNKYLPNDKTKTQFVADLKNLTSYPLRSESGRMSFSKPAWNVSDGSISFNIYFPEGFEDGIEAKFGFGSTQINTGTVTPWFATGRTICKDGAGNLHVVWLYNTTTVRYANSADGITWNLNTSFINGTATNTRNIPSISCDGNNITVGYEDSTLDDAMVAISTDNGATWTWKNPITFRVTYRTSAAVIPERRGSTIYLVYLSANDDPADIINFTASTNGGNTWSSPKTIMTVGAVLKQFRHSIVVDGNGGSNDKIYVVARDSADSDVYFVNSTDSGTTWGSKVNIMTGTYDYPSITFNGTNLYVIAWESTANDIYFTNSTNGGITWTTPYRIDLLGTSANQARYPTVTVDNNGVQYAFWQQNATYSNNGIVSMNLTGWNISTVDLSIDNSGNAFVNTPYTYYGDDKIHYVYRNGTASPYQIMYDFVNLADIIVPTYSQNSTNSTIAGSQVNHTQLWQDETGLSGCTFFFDNCTGTFVNDTWIPVSGTSNWTSTVKGINTTVSCTIRWGRSCNDTSNNWNYTNWASPFSYVTTSSGAATCWTRTDQFLQVPGNCLYHNLGGAET